jgi:hypothetical protein
MPVTPEAWALHLLKRVSPTLFETIKIHSVKWREEQMEK